MTMGEMHENRSTYVSACASPPRRISTKNGLELESVAIIDIDQTPLEYFNPSNRFDAEGLTALIKDIEARRTLRNDIEQDSMIQIRSRNLEAEKQALDIERAERGGPAGPRSAKSNSAAPSNAPNWPGSGPNARPRPKAHRSRPAKPSRRPAS
jgi:uncharacterized membrane protein YqiK